MQPATSRYLISAQRKFLITIPCLERSILCSYSLRRTGGDLFPQIWALDSNPHTTNEAFGTRGFAPPEVWQCKYYSYGVDYFAMGCVLHELLTGNVNIVFQTHDNNSLLKAPSQLPFAYDSAVDKYDVFTIVVDPDYVLEGVQRDFLKKVCLFSLSSIVFQLLPLTFRPSCLIQYCVQAFPT